MKINTYTAPTEQQAIEMVNEDLGKSAVILTIKKISPKGIFKFFRKQRVEVTAATDDLIKKEAPPQPPKAEEEPPKEKPPALSSSNNMLKDVKISEQEIKIKTLEQMLANNEELLKNIVSQLTATQETAKENSSKRFDNHMLQVFYDTLIKNGVTPEIADELLGDLDSYFDDTDTNVSIIVKLVYNRIIQKLGEPKPIEIVNGPPKQFVFMGPTGVGKTTTIAKLASHLILNGRKKVALVTADTYRIAAVEQLKTYGDILGINIEVVYNPEDLKNSIDKVSRFCDIILIDTAGRSHKNEENIKELRDLLAIIPEAELFLVLSTTTKYEDLRVIANVYSAIADYSIIFTKIDETGNLGLALNICCETGKRLSYVTDGQNVPEDIRTAEPAMIAKALLGSIDY